MSVQDNPRFKAMMEYAKRGWRVIPLHSVSITPEGAAKCSCFDPDCENSRGKHPRIKGWKKDATTDEKAISKWVQLWPELNIGIATGNGLLVIDLDVKHNGIENWEAICTHHEKLPDGPMVLTGSGGRHLYFRMEGPIPQSVSKIGKGIDVRGDGGLVVAPPSTHYNGKQYDWELSSGPDVPIPLAPEWLVSQVRMHGDGVEDQPKKPSKKRTQKVTIPEDGIPDGERNDTLFRLGRSLLAQNFDEEAIRAALHAQNTAKCKPPLDPKEVDALVESVLNKDPGLSDEYEDKKKKKSKSDRKVYNSESAYQRLDPQPDEPPPSEDADPPPPPEPMPRTQLTLGDAAEIGLAAINAMRGSSPVNVVHDLGEFYKYDQYSGVWKIYPREEIVNFILGYSGALIDEKPLMIYKSTYDGAIDAAVNNRKRPGFFDKAPPGIAFTNGFVTVKDGKIELHPHSPDHRALHQLPFAYNPNADRSRWIKALEEMFTFKEEGIPVEEQSRLFEDQQSKITLLQEFSGASLIGDATTYQMCLVLVGGGSDGKSVVTDCTRAMFPKNALQSTAPQLWENRFYLAELAGARLNAVNELPDKEFQNTDAFKSVITGNATTVARKYQRPFEMIPRAGHLFSCNELPSTKDQSDGFFRRFAVIAFERKFQDNEKDIHLTETLIKNHLPGIVAWAIEGAASLQRRGHYKLPQSSDAKKKEWQENSDQIRQWVSECTTDGGRMNPTEAYGSYKRWASDMNHGKLTGRNFSIRLSKILRQERDGNGRYYERTITPTWRGFGV